MEALYTHFSKPSINKKYKDVQVKLGIRKLSITKISDTRWNCRYKNCEAVKMNYKAIVIALEEEIENDSDKDVNEAIGKCLRFHLYFFRIITIYFISGILACIKNQKFIVHLFILHKVLIMINILMCKLQEKTATLGKAANIIKSVINSFESLRTSPCFTEIWNEISLFMDEHNLEIEILSQGR